MSELRTDAALEVSNLGKDYDEIVALDDVTFSIPRAELVASDLVALTRAEQQGERRRDVHAGNGVRRQDVGVPVIAHGLRRAG
jgi:hypothetical protein